MKAHQTSQKWIAGLIAAIALAWPALSHGAVLISGPTITAGNTYGYGYGNVFSGLYTGATTLGTTFTVGSQDLLVTSLGIWNPTSISRPALTTAHDVGLWNSTGTTLLGSVSIPAGGGTSVGNFLYVTLGSSVTLTANQTYRLGAVYFVDAQNIVDYSPSQAGNFSSDVSNPLASYAVGGTLAAPINTVGPGSYVGANLQYTAVPEPSTWALLAFSLTSVMVLRRRRRA